MDIDDGQISYALSKQADGDVDQALEMVLLFQESVEGVIKPYNAGVHMRGAENRQGVTCYLDSLLFAMFARLGSFEPILYTQFNDEPRRRLSTLIRLWVNMLRSGKLIQTDIVRYVLPPYRANANVWRRQGICKRLLRLVDGKMLQSLSNKTHPRHLASSPKSWSYRFSHSRWTYSTPEQKMLLTTINLYTNVC
jgi:hypothetical protein